MNEWEKERIDTNRKERIVFESQMLHYGLYMPDPENGLTADIPWHWHDAFEFGYVAGGSILYKTNRREYVLRNGDGIFINSGALHYLHPLEPAAEATLYPQFFDKSFLAGAPGSLYDLKYITPVQEMKILDAMPLYRHNPQDLPFLEKLRRCRDLSMEREPFFELRIRNLFSEMWETVYARAMAQKNRELSYDPTEDGRIKRMLSLLQERCSEKITAADLARAAHISERECYRIFQHVLGITPGDYLLSLRLQKAQELLWHTDKSILEIALETGMGTGSYLCKRFKACYHVTPGQYRQQKKQFRSPPPTPKNRRQ